MTIIKNLYRHPRKRYMYAVTGGKYLGELLVYCSSNESDHCFLSLPLMKNRFIPKEKLNFGITEKIVEVVEKIPRRVYKVCVAQYNKNVEDKQILA
jgi:hypothetical protein